MVTPFGALLSFNLVMDKGTGKSKVNHMRGSVTAE